MRPFWPRILLSLSVALVLAVIVIEVTSRIADGRLAAKMRDPAFDYRTYKPSFLDKVALDTLEYGTVKRGAEQSNARNVPHPYLGYALTPNFRSPPGAAQQVAHNSLGFRGKETTWTKPPGIVRIVTTGGSSVYGQSESCDAAVWSQRLEDILNASGSARKFEVVNVGCNGWSSFEMLINLELRALDFSPDLVIVYEAINDMRCAVYKRGGPVTPDNLQWRDTWPVDRPSALERFLGHSRAYLVWRRYATDYVLERSDLGFYAIKNYDPAVQDMYWDYAMGPIPDQGFENYRRNLTGIVSVCRARGARVLFATQALPRWHLKDIGRRKVDSSQEQLDAFERILATQREVAKSLDVPLFDSGRIVEQAVEQEIQERVAERLRKEPGADAKAVETELEEAVPNKARDLLFFSEVHPNDRGSDLIAHTIGDYLLHGDLIPR
jgi:lysophospholipase L1-like esterase